LSPDFPRDLPTQIIFERAALGSAQKAQVIPALSASVRAQRRLICSSDDGEVDILRQVTSDTVETVDQERAHRARARLPLSVHELIDHNRAIRRGEQLTQSDRSRWGVTGVEIRQTFNES